jgi:hypothetical protein
VYRNRDRIPVAFAICEKFRLGNPIYKKFESLCPSTPRYASSSTWWRVFMQTSRPSLGSYFASASPLRVVLGKALRATESRRVMSLELLRPAHDASSWSRRHIYYIALARCAEAVAKPSFGHHSSESRTLAALFFPRPTCGHGFWSEGGREPNVALSSRPPFSRRRTWDRPRLATRRHLADLIQIARQDFLNHAH